MPDIQRDSKTLTTQDLLQPGQSKLSEFVQSLSDSFCYSLVQAPLTGASQLADRTIGTNWEEKTKLFAEPKAQDLGTSGWYGQVLGGTIGTALPFIAMHKLVGPGAASKMELTANYGLGRQALQPLVKSAITGAVYTGVFMPVKPEDGDFWTARLRNATVAGVTFPLLTAGSIGLKASGSKFLQGDIAASALPGFGVGALSADLHSLLKDGHLASMNDRVQSAATFAVGGAFLGAGNTLHESLKPTSGIKGVRTLADMKALAESTQKANFEQRPAMPASGDSVFAQLERVQRKALEFSTLSGEDRKLVVNGNRDLVQSLETMQTVDQPKVTIYGSARLGKNTFEHWRAQYTAGRLAQEGFAVVSGGAQNGIMGAVNEGAYKAGGKSIGISINLPNEPKTSPYHDATLMHDRFFTRKEVLRRSDAFIVEAGGLGTIDEAAELLTHIQTKQMEPAPVYFVGKQYWAPFVEQMKVMLKAGTISKSDMSLFKVVDDPNQIISDLVQKRDVNKIHGLPPVQVPAGDSVLGTRLGSH